ncbi:MAG: glycoside hydrolase family 95 protein [Dysgonamonadaceae bacterium]|jgi:alpha-L-fucosidase 2|nr:glycoside hydrolase family 95 protein [Dysgonamonadaceae bacterium]
MQNKIYLQKKSNHLKQLFAIAIAVTMFSFATIAQTQNSQLVLQYNAPAPDNNVGWHDWSLPIGNGYSGANIFGRVDRERLQLSEESLWTGGPINRLPGVAEGGYDNVYEAFGNVHRDHVPATPVLYRQLRVAALGNAGDVSPPDYETISGRGLFADYFPNNRANVGSYQNFSEVYFHLLHNRKIIDENDVENYLRWLNIETATAGTQYTYNGVTYRRSHFASYPNRVIITRFEADASNSISFTLNPTIPHREAGTGAAQFVTSRYGKTGSITTDLSGTNPAINLQGMLRQNGLQFAARFEVIIEGNNYTVTEDILNGDGILVINNADKVTIIKSLGTDHINKFPTYRTGINPMYAVADRARAAVAKGYETLHREHVADFQEIFNRVALNLGGANVENMTTDHLLEIYRNDETDSAIRRALEELHFQYGRYLLITSSRPGSLPANLQGVWNVWEVAPWSSDYHLNINLQMNYWPANNTNMKETLIALLDFIDGLRRPGRDTARLFFGVGEGSNPDTEEPGFVTYHVSNPFGFTGAHNSHNLTSSWGHAHYAMESVAWIVQNIYNIYQFYPDKELLKTRIYPILREASMFYSSPEILVECPASKRLVVSPSYSSEHGPMWAGSTFQQQLIWQLFQFTIEAAEILDIDTDFRQVLANITPRLSAPNDKGPVPIGKMSGAPERIGNGVHGAVGSGTVPGIKEWWWETGYGQYLAPEGETATIPSFDPGHRHLSHMVGLHPGNLITQDTPEWLDAAVASLNIRGDGATGWSRGHKTNLWTRTGDGDRAFLIYEGLIRSATLNNLWGFHSGGYAGPGSGTTNDQAGGRVTTGIYQIDGSLGGTAGVAEMLLQSHEGFLRPLPALPSIWHEGSVKGLTAIGGFVVDITWSNNELDTMQITSSAGKECVIRYHNPHAICVVDAGGNRVELTVAEDRIGFETKKGEAYRVNFVR